MTYEEAINYLEAANVFGIQLGLGRIQNLLERLGNPQNKYQTIHVTGTNGKYPSHTRLFSTDKGNEADICRCSSKA